MNSTPNYLRNASLKNEAGKMYSSLLNGRLNRIKIAQAKRNGLERVLATDTSSLDDSTSRKIEDIRTLVSLYTKEPEIRQRANEEFHPVNEYLLNSMKANAKKEISRNYLDAKKVDLQGLESSVKVKEYVPIGEYVRDARIAVTNGAVKTGKRLFGFMKNKIRKVADYIAPRPNLGFAYQR